jgi:hypothetical protein
MLESAIAFGLFSKLECVSCLIVLGKSGSWFKWIVCRQCCCWLV